MRIHLIATGGAVMHNLALALQNNHHTVSGSDDEIYNPARDRLAAAGLLPEKFGWNADRITPDLDAVILGMHARPDNPELLRAQELNLPIYSFPEFIYENSKEKTRIVVAGSHGKTSTTAMIMHVFRKSNKKFDYLVGAQLDGFDTMVQLSDAPVIILEGDEYLSSPIDRRPKFLHYRPHLTIMTGIEHDHVNVFPEFKTYKEQFSLLAESMPGDAKLFYFDEDAHLTEIMQRNEFSCSVMPYAAFRSEIENGKTIAFDRAGQPHPLQIFGKHNLENLRAAYEVCLAYGITEAEFWAAAETFAGAAKRLETVSEKPTSLTWRDFAHAPSKVRATTAAAAAQYPDRELVAVFELHTFSSLNKDFIGNYRDTMNAADRAFIYFSEHTLRMKKMPLLTKEEVAQAFNHPHTEVFTDAEKMKNALEEIDLDGVNLLLMSSGKFGGVKGL